MKQAKTIQLKAAFLLLVFSLNTIVGFACSVGLDMGFNSPHHHEEENAAAKHHHHKSPHHYKNKSQHHHDEATDHHHNSKDGKSNCCNDGVIKFTSLDKAVPAPVALPVPPLFFTAFTASFFNVDIFYPSQLSTTSVKFFVRSYHPPISDIRIAIQSFQI